MNPDADLRRHGGSLDRTPFNLNLERSHELALRVSDIRHRHLVIWGDAAMFAAMPDCRLINIPGVGHSMNLESPALYAGYFGAWFGGLSPRKG